MEHFVLYCILMSLAVLISIVFARPERKITKSQAESTDTLPTTSPRALSSFSAWRKVATEYKANSSTEINRQLNLFGGPTEI